MTAFEPDSLDRRDPKLIARIMPIARAFTRSYLRLQVEGAENIIAQPAIFAANHNGGNAGPDVACTLSTLWHALGPEAPLYALAHDFAMRQLTPVGRAIQRIGAVRASRANAKKILGSGGSFLVYPGGDLEAYRHARRRDKIIIGERTGFVRMAQDAGVPIVPIVAYGAHRSAYIFHEGENVARVLGLKRWARVERFPIALALPWGIVAGPWLPYAPLPFGIRLRILPPERVEKDQDVEVVAKRVEQRMQHALDDMASA